MTEKVNTYDPIAGETVEVPGHPMDREPEMSEKDARIKHLMDNLDESECPIVIESDMRADPVEGVQGTYTAVVPRECPECPSEFALSSQHTLAGIGCRECLLCGTMIDDNL